MYARPSVSEGRNVGDGGTTMPSPVPERSTAEEELLDECLMLYGPPALASMEKFERARSVEMVTCGGRTRRRQPSITVRMELRLKFDGQLEVPSFSY